MENKNNLNEVKGYELKPPCPCDQCVTETDDCRKLILAGGEHLCATPKDIDWEQRRYEIAKTMLPQLYMRSLEQGLRADPEKVQAIICAGAIQYADKLIEELKKSRIAKHR